MPPKRVKCAPRAPAPQAAGPDGAFAALEHLDRVLGSFEAYCTVTQSIAAAIPVDVEVLDADGRLLKPASPTVQP